MFEGRGVLLARMLSHSDNHCTFSVMANDRSGVSQIVLYVADYEHRQQPQSDTLPQNTIRLVFRSFRRCVTAAPDESLFDYCLTGGRSIVVRGLF